MKVLFFIFVFYSFSLSAFHSVTNNRNFFASELNKETTMVYRTHPSLIPLAGPFSGNLHLFSGSLLSQEKRQGGSIMLVDNTEEMVTAGALTYSYQMVDGQGGVEVKEQSLELSLANAAGLGYAALSFLWDEQKSQGEKTQQFMGKLSYAFLFSDSWFLNLNHSFGLYEEGRTARHFDLAQETQLAINYSVSRYQFILHTLYSFEEEELEEPLLGLGAIVQVSSGVHGSLDASYSFYWEKWFYQAKLDVFLDSVWLGYSYQLSEEADFATHNIDLRYPF